MDFEKQIQADRESLIQDIMKLVSIDSVETAPDAGMPFGAGAAKALDCFLETAESIGLKTENFDHYAGHADYGDQEETLGILGHVDVVPCSGNWVCDPFKPEIIDGKLYGRGVLDDKGPLLACLHAVKILKEMGVPLSKKIRFIVGANEETDWKCMDYYFNKKKIPAPQMSFTPDAVFPLIYAEKGVFQYQLVTDVSEDITLSGGNAFNAVADHASVLLPLELETVIRKSLLSWETQTRCHFTVENAGASLRLTAEGFAAHAAHPSTGINAISGLMSALSELSPENELARIATFYMEHRDMSNTDYLTQLKNRNAYQLDIGNRIAGKAQEGTGFILLDLNGLKHVNDTLGHDAGDVYITCVSKAYLNMRTREAVMYRIGGDEFVVVMPDADRDKIQDFMRRFGDMFNREASMPEFTFSWGYSIYDPKADADLYSTCRRADKNMYMRKQQYYKNKNT